MDKNQCFTLRNEQSGMFHTTRCQILWAKLALCISSTLRAIGVSMTASAMVAQLQLCDQWLHGGSH